MHEIQQILLTTMVELKGFEEKKSKYSGCLKV
jgi:hypothetical protein